MTYLISLYASLVFGPNFAHALPPKPRLGGEVSTASCAPLLLGPAAVELKTSLAEVPTGLAYFKFMHSPDGRTDRSVRFVFLPSGRLALESFVYGPPVSRFVDRMVSRIITLDPDGTVLKQVDAGADDPTALVPTERYGIDVNHAHLILGFARHHAGRADGGLLLKVVDMLKSDLPAAVFE